MSTRYNNGSHYENHQRAAELHDLAAHAHRSAEVHLGKQDHQTGREHSRQALEHSTMAFVHTQELHELATAEIHEEIAVLAYQLWIQRGSPEGSPGEDWSRAVAQLHTAHGEHQKKQ